MKRETVFIGVDLGFSEKRKSTGLAYLIEIDGKPGIESSPVHILSKDTDIHKCLIKMSENFSSTIIGIDAPLLRPKNGSMMRECEKKLRIEHRIPCFPSGADFVHDWVEKGINLKKWAEKELGAKVIEVYPYAARVKLDIGVKVKKKTLDGRKIIQKELLPLIEGLTLDRYLSTDELDAILSAYTAYRYCEGIGGVYEINGDDGTIYLPKKI